MFTFSGRRACVALGGARANDCSGLSLTVEVFRIARLLLVVLRSCPTKGWESLGNKDTKILPHRTAGNIG